MLPNYMLPNYMLYVYMYNIFIIFTFYTSEGYQNLFFSRAQ